MMWHRSSVPKDQKENTVRFSIYLLPAIIIDKQWNVPILCEQSLLLSSVTMVSPYSIRRLESRIIWSLHGTSRLVFQEHRHGMFSRTGKTLKNNVLTDYNILTVKQRMQHLPVIICLHNTGSAYLPEGNGTYPVYLRHGWNTLKRTVFVGRKSKSEQ